MSRAFMAIPSSYNGIKFRSRLEARWAVFLDEIGVNYFYEHEGYQLKSGWYLPDFYLPDLLDIPTHLEIKPKRPDMQESQLCAELALTTKQKVVCFYGNIEVQDQFPKADTYGKSVCRKAIEGPGSIDFDLKTLIWQTSDSLPPDLKTALLKIKSEAIHQDFWMPVGEPLYWCECPCCNRIRLISHGRLSPSICGNSCKFYHDKEVRQQYIEVCQKDGQIYDESSASKKAFICTNSPRLLQAYKKAQKYKFW